MRPQIETHPSILDVRDIYIYISHNFSLFIHHLPPFEASQRDSTDVAIHIDFRKRDLKKKKIPHC